jgi:ABC-type glutathione transport system ATPase component
LNTRDPKQHLKIVRNATGLKGTDLATFLAALDFSECGTESRFGHRERIVQAIAKLLEGNAGADATELQQRVRELMLPERSREIMTQGRLLAWFSIADIRGLFPCPEATVKVTQPVLREPAQSVVTALKEGKQILCVDGPGGCGKTTVMHQIAGLPLSAYSG